MLKKLIFILFLILSGNRQFSHAQFFQKAYGERNDREGVYFQSVADGYIIAGTALDTTYNTRGYYILKLDKNGQKVWERQYSDAFSAYTYGLAVLDNGNIAIVGTHAGIFYTALAEVVMLDSAGNFLGSQTYPPLDGWGTSGVGIVKTDDSSAAITIYTDGFISTNYYSIYRLNQDLTPRWTEFIGYDGSLVNNHSMIKSSTGDFFSLGYYDMYVYGPQLEFQVSNVRKFDAVGSLQLDSLYDFQIQSVSISPTNDGGCIITGNHDNGGQTDVFLIKLDANGEVNWTNELGSALNENTVQALQTSDGGYALIATIPDLILLNQNDIVFIRCDANGDSLYSKQLGSTLNETALHLEQTPDSNFAILGTTTSFGLNHIFFAIVDSLGNTPVEFTVNGNGRYFCDGDSLTLTLNPAPDSSMHINWSCGDTVSQITVRSTGNYFATITDTLGNIKESNNYSVYFAATPAVAIGTDTMGICVSNELENSYTTDFTVQYQWYLNDTLIPGATTSNYKPTGVGKYMLIASNYCTSDTGIVFIDTIYSNPPVPILVSPSVDYVCSGDSLRISVDVDSTSTLQWYVADDFNWYVINGEVDSVFYANYDGVFFVRVTDINGCYNNSDPKVVAFDNIPALVNTNGPSSFCQGGEVELSTEPGSNFLWSTSDTSSTITVNTAGDYFVTYTNQFGCLKNSDTISITILPSPFVSIGPDTTVCNDEIYVLDAGPGFNNYLWNIGTVSQSIFLISFSTAIDTQVVFVFVTDTNGCTNSDTAQVIFDICIGVDEFTADENLYLYPTLLNSGASVHVHSEYSESVFSVFDMTGKMIHRRAFGSDLDEVLGLPGGFYMYRIEASGNRSKVGKMIIQ
ncbi:MAG: hypothetical protein ACO1G9_12560 [Bacteroidota bacterium]